MDNMLENLVYGISENNSDMIDSVYEDFEKNAFVTDDEQNRILSSVMRKAGFDMKETISIKKTRKISKRIAGIVIAAAAMLIGAVTAAAYYAGYRLEDGQIIRKFYGENAETWLDSNELNEKQVEQNGHFDVTMYSFISDGYFCESVWCIEALDEAARNKLGSIAFYSIQAYYADTGEEVNMAGSSSGWDELLNDDTHHYYSQKMPLNHVDTSRDIEFRIENSALVNPDSDDDLTEGLKFVVNASPNVETKVVSNGKGAEFVLSPLGASHIFRAVDHPLRAYDDYPGEVKDACLIKSDGSYEYPNDGRFGLGRIGENDGSEVLVWINFGGFIDISDVIGIKIDDEIYLEVN